MGFNQDVIQSIEEVTTEWLTAVLRKSNAMTEGRVESVEADLGGGHWSQNASLTLKYSPNSMGVCPKRLFLKMVNTDLGDGEYFLPSEVTYYQRDYIDLSDAPLVRCFDGAYDAEQNRYHVLLEDVSETHVPAYDLVPDLEHGKVYAEALAKLHACWWGVDRLKSIDATFHDAQHLQQFVDYGREGIEHTLTIFKDRLKLHWPDLIHEIFDKLPARLANQAVNPSNFTLIHGDPNEGNILVPKEGIRPLYLIDQQPFDFSITTWLGAYDLAYYLGLYWDRTIRKSLEIDILKHYHVTLIERGVSDYEWEQLFDDYRLCIALMVPVAVEYMCDGGDPNWNDFRFNMISHALTAFEDLKGHQIL